MAPSIQFNGAAETVTGLLTDIKGKIVAAQEANVDRTKIQTDLAALRDQIGNVVTAAQFIGLKLGVGSQASISIVIYQMSSAVGRGFPRAATIS
jgi:flagellin